MSKPLLLSCLLLLQLALLTACGAGGCEETRESFCVCDLRSISGASLRSISVWGIGQFHVAHPDSTVTDADPDNPQFPESAGNDSIMIDGETSPSNISLILNPDTTATSLRILFTGTADNEAFQYEDTLTIRYEAYPYFLDMECGCSVYFTLHDVAATGNFIQEVYIKKNEITNEEAINIVIEY